MPIGKIFPALYIQSSSLIIQASGVADSVVVPMNPYIYSGQLNITTPVIYTSGACVEECPE